MLDSSLFIPVILGTPRQGRQSEHVAKFIVEQVAARDRLETELIDIRNMAIAVDDAGESLKDPEFSATMQRADGLIIVTPEYNHGYPGLLKHVLDTCLKEYIHKADDSGQRPVYGGIQKFQIDPHWQDLILFHEYFHGDNGAGIGASHQTGWTGLVAKLIQQCGEYQAQHQEPEIHKDQEAIATV